MTGNLMLILMILAMYGGMAFWFQHAMRQGDEDRETKELDEVERQKSLRRYELKLRLGAFMPVVLIIAATAMLVAGAASDFAVMFLVLGVLSIFGWRAGAAMLKVDRIPDRDQRNEAFVDLRWRWINLLPWFLGALLVLHLSLWAMPTYFGLSLPVMLSGVHSISFQIYGIVGAYLLAGGLAGRLLKAEPHCAACGYPYDTLARSDRCPECGEALTENKIKHKRWVRSPKLIAFGAVAILLVTAHFANGVSSTTFHTMASISPTKGLIVRLHGGEFKFNNKIALWTELQKRMPLSALDRDRLVEALIASAKDKYDWTFMPTTGVSAWLNKELAAGPHSEEHLDHALKIVEKADFQSDAVYRIDTLLTALYATPVSELTPVQIDRLVKFTFEGIESDVANGLMLNVNGGAAWLKTQSTNGRLSPAQEERLRGDAAHGAASSEAK